MLIRSQHIVDAGCPVALRGIYDLAFSGEGDTGMDGVESKCLGGFDVGGRIIDEEALVGLGLDLLKEGEVDVIVGFGQMHLLGEEHAVEVAIDLLLTSETAVHDVYPMGIVGVKQHVGVVAFLLEFHYFVETVLGNADAAGVPSIQHLLEGGARTAVLLDGAEKNFGGDGSDLVEVDDAVGYDAFTHHGWF